MVGRPSDGGDAGGSDRPAEGAAVVAMTVTRVVRVDYAVGGSSGKASPSIDGT
jgi:hypothetical protein